MGSDRGTGFVLGAIFGIAAVLLAAGLVRSRQAPAPALRPHLEIAASWPITTVHAPFLSPDTPVAAVTAPSAPLTHKPGRALTNAEFVANPGLLETRPTDVGGCRLVEHWNTGYCYVWSRSYDRKISQTTDARCDDLPELRRRMQAAIERGDCD